MNYGNKNISQIFLGDKRIVKVYLGDKLIYLY